MIADDNFYDVARIIGPGNEADLEHVYASWLNRNDYFVTENVDDFIRDGTPRAARGRPSGPSH